MVCSMKQAPPAGLHLNIPQLSSLISVLNFALIASMIWLLSSEVSSAFVDNLRVSEVDKVDNMGDMTLLEVAAFQGVY